LAPFAVYDYPGVDFSLIGEKTYAQNQGAKADKALDFYGLSGLSYGSVNGFPEPFLTGGQSYV
jgi:hypothetical protein